MTAFELPANLASADSGADEELRAWTAALPDLVDDLACRWSLDLEAPFQPGGTASWVAPARTATGEPAVLKVGWPHDEALHEADALRLWAGGGAVLLLDADERGDTIALLLEACEPGTPLSQAVPPTVQDEVIAGLLRRLWVEPVAGHPFRTLQEMCDGWADEFDEKPAADGLDERRLDPGLERAGMELFRALPGTAGRSVLLCTDLHAHNVLAARREPWLVIDPKPYVGDPAYDALQHMLNHDDRLTADPVGFAERMAGLLDLDPERVRLWLFARCVQESPGWPALREAAVALAPA